MNCKSGRSTRTRQCTCLRLIYGYVFKLFNYSVKNKALATGTAAVHQNINSKDTAVLLRMLSLLPYNTAVPYSNNHWLFIRQKTYSSAKMFVYFSAVSAQFYAKPSPSSNPDPHLTLTQPFPRVLHGEAAIVLTEMQVTVHVQTRCRTFRLWDYEYGCCTFR